MVDLHTGKPSRTSSLRSKIEVDVVEGKGAVGPGMWECNVCERVMMVGSKGSHLKGSLHEKAKLKRRKTMGKEVEGEFQRAGEMGIEEGKRKEEKELQEFRKAKQTRNEEERKNREALRLMEQIRLEEEKQQRRIAEARQKKEKELEEFRLAERIRIDEEERKNKVALRLLEQARLEEEKRKMQQERDELQRTEMENEQLEQASATEEQRRIEQEEEDEEIKCVVGEVEEWKKQRRAEKGQAGKIAEQIRIEAEYRQGEEDRIRDDEKYSIVASDISGGVWVHGGGGVQNTGEGTVEALSRQAIMIQYMQWQAMMQEIYRQQVQQQQIQQPVE